MHRIFLFLLQHISTAQIFLFLIVITTLWFIEATVSFDSLAKKWQHSSTNILVMLSALPVQLGLSFCLLMVSNFVTTFHFGIIYLLPHHKNVIVFFALTFIMLDFFEYTYHLIMHKFGRFWKFHKVHHSDLKLDVSTTLREHPVETLIRMSFTILWVTLSGASIGVLIFRQILQSTSNILAHSTVEFPEKIEKKLNWLFITPRLHHVHHHFEMPYTDSNYGDILCIWDRLFGTYKELSKSKIVYGLDVCSRQTADNQFNKVIKIPFER